MRGVGRLRQYSVNNTTVRYRKIDRLSNCIIIIIFIDFIRLFPKLSFTSRLMDVVEHDIAVLVISRSYTVPQALCSICNIHVLVHKLLS